MIDEGYKVVSLVTMKSTKYEPSKLLMITAERLHIVMCYLISSTAMNEQLLE